jgi:hypothetical protein
VQLFPQLADLEPSRDRLEFVPRMSWRAEAEARHKPVFLSLVSPIETRPRLLGKTAAALEDMS